VTKFYGIICVAGSASKEAMMALVADQVSAFDMNKVDDGEWDWWNLPTSRSPSFVVKRVRGTVDDYLEREAARLLRCDALVTAEGDWLDESAFGESLDDFSVFALNPLRQASDDVSVMYLLFHS
jgi:hypothetical protein